MLSGRGAEGSQWIICDETAVLGEWSSHGMCDFTRLSAVLARIT